MLCCPCAFALCVRGTESLVVSGMWALTNALVFQAAQIKDYCVHNLVACLCSALCCWWCLGALALYKSHQCRKAKRSGEVTAARSVNVKVTLMNALVSERDGFVLVLWFYPVVLFFCRSYSKLAFRLLVATIVVALVTFLVSTSTRIALQLTKSKENEQQ